MSKKSKANEEFYIRARDATKETVTKNRKFYDFLIYVGMIGTLVCLFFSAIKYSLLCLLLTMLFMMQSLIFRNKEAFLDSMTEKDQLERFFENE